MSVWKWDTVQVLGRILLFGVILLLIFSKTIQLNDLTINTVIVRVTLNKYKLEEWANL